MGACVISGHVTAASYAPTQLGPAHGHEASSFPRQGPLRPNADEREP